MTRIEVDYNRTPFSGAFSLPLRTDVAAKLRVGEVVELDGGDDVPTRRAEVVAIDGRRVRFRFTEALRVSA